MTVSHVETRQPAAGQPQLRYQPALDGLRAVAVLAVMLYHGGVGWARGGFLGVDVFFVLSGYLITTLLLTEWSRWGSIDLFAFWGRRARRLLPALFLMLLAVALYAVALAPEAQRATLRGQGLSTLFYVSNWWMIAHEQSYFAQFLQPSPLTHTWSLAIEEQWYLFFPLALAGVLALRNGRVRRLALWLAGLALLSAIWMAHLYDPAADPSRVYFGTDTRVQDLLVGAALAAWLLSRRDTPRRASIPRVSESAVVGIGGFLAVLLTMFLVDDRAQLLYYGGFLAFSVLCAAVVATAVSPSRSRVRGLLSREPLRLVGLISYGLYLWHWPIFIVLTPARTGLHGMVLLAVRFAVTFAVAIVSFTLLERPIRRGVLHQRIGPRRTTYVAVAAVAVIAVVTVLATPGQGSAFAQEGTGSATEITPTGSGVSTFFVGDSVSYGLRLYFTPAAAPGIRLNGSSRLGCGLIPKTNSVDGKPDPAAKGCAEWAAGWPAEVKAAKPDLSVLFLGSWEQFDIIIDGHVITFGTPEYANWLDKYFDTALADLAESSKVVAVMNVPCHRAYEDGINQIPTIVNDQTRIDWLNNYLVDYQRRSATHFQIIDFNSWLCVQGDPMTRDGVKMRSDGLHFTQEGAAIVWKWLGPKLVQVYDEGLAAASSSATTSR